MNRRTGDPPPGRKAVAAVQGGEELLGLALQAGQMGILDWRVREGTVRLSPELVALYGLGTFDGRYESWMGCIYREDVPRISALLEDAFASRASVLRAEFRVVRPNDGALRWMEARGRVLYDAEGRPVRVVGVNADVTERKRAVAQLRAFSETLEERVRERTRELEAQNEARAHAEELLRQAQKMEAIGQLTGGVAHDFNNLLTIIMGGLEAIGRRLPDLPPGPATARIERSREMALQGVRRAATLTQRMLAFARRQPLAPKPIEADALVAGMSELLRRTLGETVELQTVLTGGLWRTLADANQLENALLNLAVNARDAMPEGGRLTVETQNADLDEAYVAGLAEPVPPGQYVLIAVADTGHGMDRATLERVFEPFFTTKAVGKGTGLGLSQVYGFVRQSGGHVMIHSEPGEGTTVKVYLPRLHEDRERGRKEVAPGPEAPPAAAGNETILLVEDEAVLRAYGAEALRELGYRVLEAPDGRTALEILKRHEQVTLLFTDVVLSGGMNGRQLADEAARCRPGLKVLFATGYARNAIVHHGRLDPGVRLLAKPFTYAEMAARVRRLLDEE